MPRISRVKAKRHAPAAQLEKRPYAVPEEQTERVEMGSEAHLAVQEVLAGPSVPKKQKGLLLPTNDYPLHPYSKSHRKRENKKRREQLAGGKLSAVAEALDQTLSDSPESPTRLADPTSEKKQSAGKESRKPKTEDDGKLSEGKGRTMAEKKRRKQIALEAKRIPLIMSHPAYKKDPWATIRLHASNTLAMKEMPAARPQPGNITIGGGGMQVEP